MRMTVAALRGVAGACPESKNRVACSANQPGAGTRAGSVPRGPGSVNVNHDRRTLTDADAGGRHGVPTAAPAQLAGGIHHDPGG